MTKVKLVAIKSFPYGGRNLKDGDEFEASASDAKLLKAIGKAEDVSTDNPAINTREITTEGTRQPEHFIHQRRNKELRQK